MKKTKVIDPKNAPGRLPFGATALLWLLMDRLKAPGWAWGIAGTLLAIWWVGAIAQVFFTEQRVDIFKEPKQERNDGQ